MNDVMIFPRSEQETTISFSRYDDMIEVYTSDSTVITKLNKVVATDSIRDYGVVVCIDENENRLKIYSFKNAIGGTVHD